MLFTKSLFALVAAASIANATITCTVDVTTTPALPSILGTIVAYVADSAITAVLPVSGGTVSTSSSVTDTNGVFAFTISASDPGVPNATLISDLDGLTLGESITILGETISLSIAVSNCHT